MQAVSIKTDPHGLRLRPSQLWALVDGIESLHLARSPVELMESAVALLRPFFDADWYAVGFTDPARRRHISIRRPTVEQFNNCADSYNKLASQSPLLQYWVRTGDHDRVLRRSDCCSPARYRQTALYREIDRLTGGEQLIGTWLRGGGGRHFELAMGRGGRTDFTKLDVRRLTVIRRHIHAAYRNVCATKAGAAAGGDGGLPADACELQDTALTAGIDAAPATATPHLTPREREVLGWIVEGKTNPEIGIILGCSWRTVRVHCERIFQKLGVETRTAAAMRAVELGWSA
jgi:DNA-binding CsgD family transcriptional regulator